MRAERRMGVILKEGPKNPGAKGFGKNVEATLMLLAGVASSRATLGVDGDRNPPDSRDARVLMEIGHTICPSRRVVYLRCKTIL